ncbi:hypothetical protein EQ882_17760, partial [Clostridioides difficile]|nr:hypothetical protein [Clostridioides difficile]
FKINNLCKNRRNYGDSLWRISKTYFSMQNSVKQEPCDFSHGRFRKAVLYHGRVWEIE